MGAKLSKAERQRRADAKAQRSTDRIRGGETTTDVIVNPKNVFRAQVTNRQTSNPPYRASITYGRSLDID
jgi:hypothetical protein